MVAWPSGSGCSASRQRRRGASPWPRVRTGASTSRTVYEGRLVDALLDGEVIRRRLWEVVRTSDLYRETVEDLRREAAGRESAMTSGGSAVSAPTR